MKTRSHEAFEFGGRVMVKIEHNGLTVLSEMSPDEAAACAAELASASIAARHGHAAVGDSPPSGERR